MPLYLLRTPVEVWALEGPEVENWEAFCDRLLPQALERVLADPPPGFIKWEDIVEALAGLLEEQGFRRLQVPLAVYPAGVVPSPFYQREAVEALQRSSPLQDYQRRVLDRFEEDPRGYSDHLATLIRLRRSSR